MSHDTKRRLFFALKTLLAVAILVFVSLYFAEILGKSQFDVGRLAVRFELLVPAGLLYLAAHLCWAAFWVRLLRFEGVRVSWYAGLRAYYVSQLAKYFPVKGMVIVVRCSMLRHDAHAHAVPVAVTAVYETLCSMAAGALLGVLLLPYLGVLPVEVSGQTALLVAVAALPVGLGVLNKYAVRVVSKRRSPAARALPAPSVFLLAQGLLHGACGHGLLGVSLGLTVLAVAPAAPGIADTYLADLGANALSYVAGFLAVVTPAGIGAREYVLATVLAPRFTTMTPEDAAALAVVVALVLRLVWSAAEVLVAVPLYLVRPPAAPVPHHTHHPELLPPIPNPGQPRG